jgi:hypothetical protein
MLIVVALVLGVGAVAALYVGWRGRRLGNHPLCRACSYDLVGHAETNECPERGADLRRRRAVPLIHDPDWAPIIGRGLQSRLEPPSEDHPRAKLLLPSEPAPENLAMDFVCRIADQEVPGGTLLQAKGNTLVIPPDPPPDHFFPEARLHPQSCNAGCATLAG